MSSAVATYEAMKTSLNKRGIKKVAEIKYYQLERLYPRYAIITKHLTKALEKRSVKEDELFPLTNFTMDYLGMMEICGSKFQFEFLMEQLVFQVREQTFNTLEDKYGRITEQQRDAINNRFSQLMETTIRPAMDIAIEEIFSCT